MAKKKSKGSLPTSLAQSTKANPATRELYICEGTSAKGTCKKARDSSFQEVLALTGKIANAARKKLHVLLESKAIQELLSCIGYDFDSHRKEDGVVDPYAKRRVGKIFLLPDSDEDGRHIAVLLLTLIHKLMPRLIEEGRVYLVDAPLFSTYYKGKRYFGATFEEVSKQLPRGAKPVIMRAKGWGEIGHETLAYAAFDPKTRTTIQVKPVRGNELQHFERLVGDDAAARKELLGL